MRVGVAIALGLLGFGCDASAPATRSAQQAATTLPNLEIDETAFENSVRFATRQRVQVGEVEEGCASGTENRSLVRFDLRVKNRGPGDVAFGAVECTSTNASPECFGRSCELNPACCCGGQSLCTTADGGSSDFFRFSCAHRAAIFRVGARVELVDGSNTVVRSRLHGLLLRDTEQLDKSDDCDAPNPHRIGEIGLRAECAALQPSSVGCQYIDATGVAPGDYTVRVTVNPLFAIQESDHDNTVIGDVTISAPEIPAERTRPVYLVCYGDGSVEEALSYYETLSPGGFESGEYSLDQWIAQFLDGRPQVDFLYNNANELGFWREMHCTKSIGRNAGGCWVRNWADVATFEESGPNLGTVAMRVDKDGITQFFAFGPDGKLEPQAILDDEGAKSIPRLCVNCHGGTYRGPDEGDLGSMFREFEPDVLERPPNVSRAAAHQKFRVLNDAIRSANDAVRSEAEGSPFGVDDAKVAVAKYLTEMYPGPGPAVSLRDPSHIPASWQEGHSTQQRRLNEELWMHLVNPYCMTCHRNNLLNWENYELWASMGPPFGALRDLILEAPDDPDRKNEVFMPQSKLAWKNLMGDAHALVAMERWLAHDETAPLTPLVADSPTDSLRGTPGHSHRARDGHVFNTPPRALAMHMDVVAPRQVVTLDARKSFDPDGNGVATEWVQVYGPPVVLFSPASDAEVRFMSPPSGETSHVGFVLTVRDSLGAIDEQLIDIKVSPAAAICDQLVEAG